MKLNFKVTIKDPVGLLLQLAGSGVLIQILIRVS